MQRGDFMYIKKMIYLELIHKSSGEWDLQEPEKLGSAGFAKMEIIDGRLNLTVNLRVVQAFLPEGEKKIRVELTDGSSFIVGTANYEKNILQFSESCVTAKEKTDWKSEEMWGIRIDLTEDYEVFGKWPGVKKMTSVSETEQQTVSPEAADRGTSSQEAASPETAIRETVDQETTSQTISSQEIQAVKGTEAVKKIQQPSKSKWETLLEQYTTVHPFQDERIYLSISPEDFTLLSEGDYHLRSNRFLLHGYYNYKHILLGKMPDSTGKEEYYIGVPGLFYEQEKKMAILFGFEGFESRTLRPTDGTFGYYMKRVML